MSDFWTSEIGEVTGNPADAFAKFKTQIPDGTTSLARIEAFINDEYQGNKFLKIEWVLTDGDFKGAIVEQKLKVSFWFLSFIDSKCKIRINIIFIEIKLSNDCFDLF